MIHITFFPHATTFDNEAGISTGNVEVGLSPLGREQIKNLKEVIREREFDAVFSSDLSRAKETAEGALGERHKIILDERLGEINIGDLTRERDEVTEPMTYSYIDIPFPNGESFKDVENRIRSFLESLKNYDNKNIAIFAHQAPQLALEVITKNVTWKEALQNDWRHTKAFQYGWEYTFEF